jgi:arylsulfatase A-like enzyme
VRQFRGATTRASRGATRRGLLAGALGLPLVAPAAATAAARGDRPNFLFMMADDMGYADLSCYGRTEYQTPEIDALAAQGIRFTSAYANSAVCTATRVALITGRYQYRLPVGLEEPLGQRKIGLPPSHPTIASLLRARGYATSLMGKWHMGSLPDYGPLKSGYEEFWGYRSGGLDYFTHDYRGEPDLWDGDTPIEKVGYLTDLLADKAIESIGRFQRQGRPWLISLHFSAPHWPWEGPEDQAESKRLAALKSPGALSDFDGGSTATYAAMVTRLDLQVGRILAALREQGADRETVVVFTSDNGGERFAKTWPFVGRKTELLEGGLRIPAIVRWPGLTKAGTESDAQIMSMDWLPTFVAAAGGAPDPAYPSDGLDLRGAIAGGALPERSLYWRYKNHGQQAMRRGAWKYLKLNDNDFLFDVVADQMERANLKARYPEKYSELKTAWNAWNKTMLQLDPASGTYGFSAKDLADHFTADSKP